MNAHYQLPIGEMERLERLEAERAETVRILGTAQTSIDSGKELNQDELVAAGEAKLRLAAIDVEIENLECAGRSSRLRVLDGGRLAARAKAPEFLVDGILETDSHGVMGGASMTFKSFIALRLAHSICTGREFMGRKIYKQGAVVYVCGEGEGGISRRIRAMEQELGPLPAGGLQIIPGTIRIDDPVDMSEFGAYLREVRPVLVILDTFASLCGRTDESSPSEVGPVLRRIKDTCRAGGASSMIVHHFGKDADRGFRGASNFTSDVDFAFKVCREADSLSTSITCHKAKDGEPFQPLYVAMNRVKLDGLTDQEGRPVFSLVAGQGESCASEPESATTEWARALHVLRSCYEGQRTALELGGRPGANPAVAWRDWDQAMKEAGISNPRRERDNLRKKGLIEELAGKEYRPKR